MNLEQAESIYKKALETQNIDERIELLHQIKSTSNELKNIYVWVQNALGWAYLQTGEFNKAYVAFNKVIEEDTEPKLSIEAKYNIGTSFKKRGNLEQAIDIWKSLLHIQQDFYPDLNFNLYNNIGDAYRRLQKFTEAETYFLKVPQSDNFPYADAQLNLAKLCTDQEQLEKAIPYLTSIKNTKDTFKQYVLAQTSLAWVYAELGQIEEARTVWQGACRLEGENEFDKLKKTYKYRLFESMLEVGKPIFVKIFLKLGEILPLLVVKEPEDDLVAHYTDPTVTYLLLTHHRKKWHQVSDASKRNSLLRLNPIHFMNDPTEGKLIHKLLNINFANLSGNMGKNNVDNLEVFMSCVTLHQNSLNQFRLYGKENGVEASGCSLVLDREKLFGYEEDIHWHTKQLNHEEDIHWHTEKLNHEETIQYGKDKLPLYRCIYFDPESGLINIAHREEWTFCRQEQQATSAKWEAYKQKIDAITKKVRDTVAEVKLLIQQANKLIEVEEKPHLMTLLNEILLPLRYLIKHHAFKEEQECRFFYLTDLSATCVKLDQHRKRVYLDYANILPAMKKIYLPSKAFHHEGALQYLGQTSPYGKFEVKRSKNPFQ